MSGRGTSVAASRPLSRRRALGLVAAAGAAAALNGCGAGRPPNSFRWQMIPSYSLQAPLPERVAYVRSRIAEYERTTGWHPIPEVSSSDITAAMAKLLLQASQGRAPEIGQVDSYLFGRFSRYAGDLTGPLAQAGLALESWFPQFREVMTLGSGQPRSIQFNTDVRVLYYRRDLVPTPPSSWDEVLSIGRANAAKGKYFLFAGSRSEDSVNTTLWPQLWSQGGEILDPDGSPAFASGPGRTAMIEGLGFLRRLILEGITPRRVANLRSDDDCNPDVLAGNVAMFLGGSWQGADLQNLVKNGDFGKEWGAAPIPSRSGENHACVAGGWTWASFAKDPEVVQQSMKLVIDAYAADAGMAKFCTLGGYLPTRESVYDHPDYRGDAFTPVFRDHLRRYARVRPLRREYQQVSSAMQIALSSVTSLSKEPEEALDAALAQVV